MATPSVTATATADLRVLALALALVLDFAFRLHLARRANAISRPPIFGWMTWLWMALDEGTSESSRCPDVAAEMDDGRAFLHVMGWLKPLFTPIARWALEELEAEQTRIDTRQAELTPDAELDQQSLGASARLNEYFTYKQGGMPEYLPTRSGSDMWTVMCIATMRDGTKQ
jgi:hypothetical protein